MVEAEAAIVSEPTPVEAAPARLDETEHAVAEARAAAAVVLAGAAAQPAGRLARWRDKRAAEAEQSAPVTAPRSQPRPEPPRDLEPPKVSRRERGATAKAERSAERSVKTPTKPTVVTDTITPVAAPKKAYVAVRRGVTGVVAAILSLACSAGVVWALVNDQDTNLAVGLGVTAVLLGLFAFRRIGSASEVRLSTEGVLELSFGETHHVFDLSTRDNELSLLAPPGGRDWRVQLTRPGLPPLEIDAASADPVLFTEALRQWRPDL